MSDDLDLTRYEGHTPGPWTARALDYKATYLADTFIEPSVAAVWNNGPDARLIADAPLLLAELKRLREELRRTSDREDRIGAEFTALRRSHARLLKELYFQRERWVLLKQVPDDPADQAVCAIRNLDAAVAEAEALNG